MAGYECPERSDYSGTATGIREPAAFVVHLFHAETGYPVSHLFKRYSSQDFGDKTFGRTIAGALGVYKAGSALISRQ